MKSVVIFVLVILFVLVSFSGCESKEEEVVDASSDVQVDVIEMDEEVIEVDANQLDAEDASNLVDASE